MTATNSTVLPLSRVDFKPAKAPYVTREEWELHTAAMLTLIDTMRQTRLQEVQCLEMMASTLGKQYKRPRGDK